jgi:hypothetical protein
MCKEEAESGQSGRFPHRGKKASADFKRKTSTEVKRELKSSGLLLRTGLEVSSGNEQETWFVATSPVSDGSGLVLPNGVSRHTITQMDDSMSVGRCFQL